MRLHLSIPHRLQVRHGQPLSQRLCVCLWYLHCERLFVSLVVLQRLPLAIGEWYCESVLLSQRHWDRVRQCELLRLSVRHAIWLLYRHY